MTILLRQFATFAIIAFIAITLSVAAESAPAEPGSDQELENVMALMVQRLTLSPHQAEWDAIAKKTREQLAGRVYSKSLLAEVTKLAAEK